MPSKLYYFGVKEQGYYRYGFGSFVPNPPKLRRQRQIALQKTKRPQHLIIRNHERGNKIRGTHSPSLSLPEIQVSQLLNRRSKKRTRSEQDVQDYGSSGKEKCLLPTVVGDLEKRFDGKGLRKGRWEWSERDNEVNLKTDNPSMIHPPYLTDLTPPQDYINHLVEGENPPPLSQERSYSQGTPPPLVIKDQREFDAYLISLLRDTSQMEESLHSEDVNSSVKNQCLPPRYHYSKSRQGIRTMPSVRKHNPSNISLFDFNLIAEHKPTYKKWSKLTVLPRIQDNVFHHSLAVEGVPSSKISTQLPTPVNVDMGIIMNETTSDVSQHEGNIDKQVHMGPGSPDLNMLRPLNSTDLQLLGKVNLDFTPRVDLSHEDRNQPHLSQQSFAHSDQDLDRISSVFPQLVSNTATDASQLMSNTATDVSLLVNNASTDDSQLVNNAATDVSQLVSNTTADVSQLVGNTAANVSQLVSNTATVVPNLVSDTNPDVPKHEYHKFAVGNIVKTLSQETVGQEDVLGVKPTTPTLNINSIHITLPQQEEHSCSKKSKLSILPTIHYVNKSPVKSNECSTLRSATSSDGDIDTINNTNHEESTILPDSTTLTTVRLDSSILTEQFQVHPKGNFNSQTRLKDLRQAVLINNWIKILESTKEEKNPDVSSIQPHLTSLAQEKEKSNSSGSHAVLDTSRRKGLQNEVANIDLSKFFDQSESILRGRGHTNVFSRSMSIPKPLQATGDDARVIRGTDNENDTSVDEEGERSSIKPRTKKIRKTKKRRTYSPGVRRLPDDHELELLEFLSVFGINHQVPVGGNNADYSKNDYKHGVYRSQPQREPDTHVLRKRIPHENEGWSVAMDHHHRGFKSTTTRATGPPPTHSFFEEKVKKSPRNSGGGVEFNLSDLNHLGDNNKLMLSSFDELHWKNEPESSRFSKEKFKKNVAVLPKKRVYNRIPGLEVDGKGILEMLKANFEKEMKELIKMVMENKDGKGLLHLNKEQRMKVLGMLDRFGGQFTEDLSKLRDRPEELLKKFLQPGIGMSFNNRNDLYYCGGDGVESDLRYYDEAWLAECDVDELLSKAGSIEDPQILKNLIMEKIRRTTGMKDSDRDELARYINENIHVMIDPETGKRVPIIPPSLAKLMASKGDKSSREAVRNRKNLIAMMKDKDGGAWKGAEEGFYYDFDSGTVRRLNSGRSWKVLVNPQGFEGDVIPRGLKKYLAKNDMLDTDKKKKRRRKHGEDDVLGEGTEGEEERRRRRKERRRRREEEGSDRVEGESSEERRRRRKERRRRRREEEGSYEVEGESREERRRRRKEEGSDEDEGESREERRRRRKERRRRREEEGSDEDEGESREERRRRRKERRRRRREEEGSDEVEGESREERRRRRKERRRRRREEEGSDENGEEREERRRRRRKERKRRRKEGELLDEDSDDELDRIERKERRRMKRRMRRRAGKDSEDISTSDSYNSSDYSDSDSYDDYSSSDEDSSYSSSYSSDSDSDVGNSKRRNRRKNKKKNRSMKKEMKGRRRRHKDGVDYTSSSYSDSDSYTSDSDSYTSDSDSYTSDYYYDDDRRSKGKRTTRKKDTSKMKEYKRVLNGAKKSIALGKGREKKRGRGHDYDYSDDLRDVTSSPLFKGAMLEEIGEVIDLVKAIKDTVSISRPSATLDSTSRSARSGEIGSSSNLNQQVKSFDKKTARPTSQEYRERVKKEKEEHKKRLEEEMIENHQKEKDDFIANRRLQTKMKLKTEMLQEEYAQALEAEKHATVEKSIKMKEQHAATLEKLKQEGKYRQHLHMYEKIILGEYEKVKEVFADMDYAYISFYLGEDCAEDFRQKEAIRLDEAKALYESLLKEALDFQRNELLEKMKMAQRDLLLGMQMETEEMDLLLQISRSFVYSYFDKCSR